MPEPAASTAAKPAEPLVAFAAAAFVPTPAETANVPVAGLPQQQATAPRPPRGPRRDSGDRPARPRRGDREGMPSAETAESAPVTEAPVLATAGTENEQA